MVKKRTWTAKRKAKLAASLRPPTVAELKEKNRKIRRMRRLHSVGISLLEPWTVPQLMLHAERKARGGQGWFQVGTSDLILWDMNGTLQWTSGKVHIPREAAEVWLRNWMRGDLMRK